jgi:TetR/AcrR family transcriptional regulator, regulator of cefoperazone and chloramphenicol sensitivity
MSAASGDLTAAATIREAAMRLFAERGAADVTLREIASAAGVSPSLIIHHYTSKAALKEAVDGRVTQLVERLISELVDVSHGDGSSSTLAEVFAERFEREPVLLLYMRRLLVDGGPPAESLVRRLFEATVNGLAELEDLGLVRPCDDAALRAAFLLANDLAVVLLRDQLLAVAGVDPLTRAGMEKWTPVVLDVYSRGVFAFDVAVSPESGRSS